MMKEMKMGIFTYNGESYDFNFKTSLSASDKRLFVKTVVNNLVDDNSYDVVIKDLVFDFAIVEVFTNVDTSFIEAKDDDGNDIDSIILIEHFLEESNVVDIVKANIESELLDELSRAVDLNIQYLTGIHFNPLNDALASLVSAIEKRVNEVDLDGAMDMVQKFVGMTGELTPESIVNAYINSDLYKKNQAEIAEVKKTKKNKSN